MKKATRTITIIGVLFFLLLLAQNIFGQATIEQKWKKYGLYQASGVLDVLPPYRIKGYEINYAKLAGFGLVALGGFSNGVLQGYEFDGRTYFERHWGKDKYSYWGSLSWANRYKNYDPAQGLANPIYKHAPVFDFYHTAQFISNHSSVSGGITVGIGAMKNKKLWHYAVDFALSMGINSMSRKAGLYLIRK